MQRNSVKQAARHVLFKKEADLAIQYWPSGKYDDYPGARKIQALESLHAIGWIIHHI